MLRTAAGPGLSPLTGTVGAGRPAGGWAGDWSVAPPRGGHVVGARAGSFRWLTGGGRAVLSVDSDGAGGFRGWRRLPGSVQ